MKTQIDDMLRVLTREKQMRVSVYGRKVADGSMSRESADKGIQAMQDVLDYVTASAAVMAELGHFADRLFNGRKQVPTSGAWYGLDSGEPTEAAITIELLKSCQELRTAYGSATPPPPEQKELF